MNHNDGRSYDAQPGEQGISLVSEKPTAHQIKKNHASELVEMPEEAVKAAVARLNLRRLAFK
jgi:hypothetical protein